MTVQIIVLDERAKDFKPATGMSAGYDLVACINEPVILKRGDKATLIPTGLKIFTNDRNSMGMIVPRSGLGHKQGLVLGNAIGIIDGDYQNEVFISALNRGQQEEITINPGDRIAQYIFVPVLHPETVIVTEFTVETERGQGGFGSTGVSQ